MKKNYKFVTVDHYIFKKLTNLGYTYATSINVPSFNQEICGRGFPTAAQSKVITDPSKAIVEWGLATNSGAFNLFILSTKFHKII